MAQMISDRVTNVAMKLGNRQDLLQPAPNSSFTYSRIAGWLRDAYIAIAYEKTFEQSEQTIQILTVQGQDTYSYPDNVRAIKSLVGQNPQSGGPITVDWKDIEYVRRYSLQQIAPNLPAQGTPSIVAPWANSIVFRPFPDQSYVFFMDCWMKPVITVDILSTVLQVPDDWLEVIDYEAAVRGHVELLERDKANEIQKLLWGYTDPATGQKVPGMVNRLGNRLDAQKPYMNWGLQPKYRSGYTSK
jgi:hypothetical protein